MYRAVAEIPGERERLACWARGTAEILVVHATIFLFHGSPPDRCGVEFDMASEGEPLCARCDRCL